MSKSGKRKIPFGLLLIVCVDCRRVLAKTSSHQTRCPECGKERQRKKMSEINRRSYLRRLLKKVQEAEK
jgi:exosome complex RNA-binding protein Csl4